MKVQHSRWLVLLLVILSFMSCHASTPVFLQAISSAIGTIPFTGFPMTMTAGLAGAKLAVGAKLLYYLGYFGMKGRSKPVPVTPAVKQPSGASSQFQYPGSFMPLPYSLMGLGGGYPGGETFQGFSHGFMPQQGFSEPSSSPIDPNVLMQALIAQGINPMQLMQAFSAIGIDPEIIIKAIGLASGTSGMSSFQKQASNVPSNTRAQFAGIRNPIMNAQPLDMAGSLPPSSPVSPQYLDGGQDGEGGSQEDIESFFSFLKDMDDNKCISRLICDIGADPSFLGEFTQNIDGIIGSLEVPPGSGANEYIEILEKGRRDGGCAQLFTPCSDQAYEIVKSVAPSVGVPNVNQGAS